MSASRITFGRSITPRGARRSSDGAAWVNACAARAGSSRTSGPVALCSIMAATRAGSSAETTCARTASLSGPGDLQAAWIRRGINGIDPPPTWLRLHAVSCARRKRKFKSMYVAWTQYVFSKFISERFRNHGALQIYRLKPFLITVKWPINNREVASKVP